MKQHLLEFEGMPGVKKRLKGPMVETVSAFMREIEKHRIVSSAGDYGSVNLYRDDKGTLRGERHVRHSTMSSAEFKTKKAAREWLTENFTLCRQSPPA